MTLRRLIVPLMAAILAVYAVAHSPLLRIIAGVLDVPARRCYFACSGWLGGGPAINAIAAALLIVASAAAAWAMAGRVRVAPHERLLVFGAGTIGFVAVPSAFLGALAGAAGVPLLQPPPGPLLASIPALATIAVTIFQRRWPPLPACNGFRFRGLVGVLVVVVSLLTGAVIAVTLGHPPTGYDALSYHGPLAVYFWRDGSIAAPIAATPWAWALAHPGTAELWTGALRIAAGERVASLGQLPFALLGGAAVYSVARRTGLPPALGAIGALAFLAAPIVVLQSGVQLNDLAAGALIMTAAAFAAAPAREWTRSRLILVGLSLGLAVTTKLAALPAALAIIVYAVVTAVRQRRPGWLAWAAGAGAVVVAPWWIRNIVMFGNPIYPAALPLIGRGYVVGEFVKKDDWFVPSAWMWPLYPLLEPHNEMSGFGALFAAAAAVGLVVAIWRAPGREPLRLFAVIAAVSLPAWWVLTQHEPRLVLGVFGLAFGFAGWMLLGVPRRHRAAAILLTGFAAAVSALVTIDQAILPRAREPNMRAAFYDRVWGVDSVVAAWPERDALVYHTGHARLSYAGDYPLLGPSLGRRLVVVDGMLPADSIAAIMRQHEIRYAYVPAAADAMVAVAKMYPAHAFELIHRSAIDSGKSRGVRRSLYRLRDE